MAHPFEVRMIDGADHLMQVHELRHVMLYTNDPDWSTVRFDEMAIIHPNDDALTASLKSVMRHVCRTKQLSRERCYPARNGDTDVRKHPSAAAKSLKPLRRAAAPVAKSKSARPL